MASIPMKAQGCLRVLLLVASAVVTSSSIVEWDLNPSSLFSKPVNSAGEKVDFLEPVGHYGGYFRVNGTEDGHLFYLYFENRYHDPDAPLVFWSNGGPGCSSLYGLFLENGPYWIQNDLSLRWNDHGWDIGHNIIFVDHPLDVGFSHGSEADKVTKEEQVAEHMLQFFLSFFVAHPELREKPLYLAGESFAGHYIPAIANRIIDANAEQLGHRIHLSGVALGDPWTNPSLQFRSYPFYEYKMGLIDAQQRDDWSAYYKYCAHDMELCDPANEDFSETVCQIGYDFCNAVLFYPIFSLFPKINYYDIRGECLVDGCYDVTKLNAFMNLPEVRERFNVSDDLEWKDCSDEVYFAMYWDCATDTTALVERLLDNGIRTLVYVGDQDLICNYIGIRDWVDTMQWTGAKEWHAAPEEIWTVGGERAGELKKSNLLLYLKVENSGHMVPTDQPQGALEMIHAFTNQSKSWTTTHNTHLGTLSSLSQHAPSYVQY